MEWPDDVPAPPKLTSILAVTVGHLPKVVVRSWDDPDFKAFAVGYTTRDDGVWPSSLDDSILITFYDRDEDCWATLFVRPR